MRFIADFHIHSKYSRATSKDMDLENLDKWAKIKGIKVLGTGDFTYPKWLKNLKEKLHPAERGLFKLKNSETRFILTSEISCIYSKREEGLRPKKVIPFKSFVPLVEIIAEVIGQMPATKRVIEEYQNLIKKLGNEFNILLNTSYQDLQTSTLPEIAEGIKRVREGKVHIEPGYDGVFGKIRIFSQGEQKILSKQGILF